MISRLLHVFRAIAMAGRHTPSGGGSGFTMLAVFSLLLAFAPSRAQAQGRITLSPTTLPNTFVGEPYFMQTLTATGGTGAKTFAVVAGVLPPGLSLASGGAITGTSTTAGSYIFLVTATDTVGATGSQGYTIVVMGPPTVAAPTSTSISAGSATLGGTVSSDGGVTVNARGVVYALTAVNPNPQLGGPGVASTAAAGTGGTGVFAVNVTKLTQGSSYSFKAYATNGMGTSYSSAATFTTTSLSMTPLALQTPVIGRDFIQNIQVSGGTAPYTFAVTAGVLPAGLTLNPSGLLLGTPTADGTFSFVVTATDFAGATIMQSFAVVITPAVLITTTALPDSGLNVPGYFYGIQATGGTGIKTLALTEGSLPAGLTMDPAGIISGMPTTAGIYNFTVMATDALNASTSRSFTIIVGGTVAITTTMLSDASVNQANYSQTIQAGGGHWFKTFGLTSGSLPAGLSLSSDGVLRGTPTTTGRYDFVVTATDTLGATATRAFSVNVNAALTITTTTLPAASLSLAYNQTIVAVGGTGTRTFTVPEQSLPPGLSLSSSGVLGGETATAGTYNFTITVTDAAGATAAQAYSLVTGGAIAISPNSLTAPVINVAGYNVTLSATGGTGAKTFAVTSGSLPTGLTLSSSGVLSGTATAAGTFNVTVTATDTVGATGTSAYSIVVAPPVNVAQTITFGTLPNRLASDGSFALNATASSGLLVTFNVTGPAILNGSTLTLTGEAGVVTVTASQAGNTTYASAPGIVQSFTVRVAPRLANLSARVRVAPDASRSLITGFVIGGQQAKRVLLRAIGPALGGFGVTGALVNPRLQIFDSAGRVVLENDDWSGVETSTAAAQVGAFALAAGSRDAAVVAALAPGSYTMQITAGTESGIALAEVYDASLKPDAEAQRLVNISTRGFADVGDGVLIGGFVIAGPSSKRVLVRGIGPALSAFGVSGALADPQLTVYGGAVVIAQNDDWSLPTTATGQQTAATAAELASTAAAVGAFSLGTGTKDSAVLVTLGPGSYTAQVAGAGTTTGVALVEIYEVP